MYCQSIMSRPCERTKQAQLAIEEVPENFEKHDLRWCKCTCGNLVRRKCLLDPMACIHLCQLIHCWDTSPIVGCHDTTCVVPINGCGRWKLKVFVLSSQSYWRATAGSSGGNLWRVYFEMRLSSPVTCVSASRDGLGYAVIIHNDETMAVWSSDDAAM